MVSNEKPEDHKLPPKYKPQESLRKQIESVNGSTDNPDYGISELVNAQILIVSRIENLERRVNRHSEQWRQEMEDATKITNEGYEKLRLLFEQHINRLEVVISKHDTNNGIIRKLVSDNVKSFVVVAVATSVIWAVAVSTYLKFSQ